MKVEEFGNGVIREDKEGKGRFDLLPWCAIIRIAKHVQESTKVYKPRNWENGLPMHSMIDSAFRHLAKYADGQMDEDHLCAAATNLLMAMWTEEKMPQMQDIPTRQSAQTDEPSTPEPDQEEFPQICECYGADEHGCNNTHERGYCSCQGDKTEVQMTKERVMRDKAEIIVCKYICEHFGKTDEYTTFNVYTVWQAKVLQNWKFLMFSSVPDGMYYELTYNGDEGEWYLDAYKKFENCVIKEQG